MITHMKMRVEDAEVNRQQRSRKRERDYEEQRQRKLISHGSSPPTRERQHFPTFRKSPLTDTSSTA
jgi:hypothetical protein